MALYLYSSANNICVKVEGPLRVSCQLKKPFKDPKLRLGRLLGGTEKKCLLIVDGWLAFVDDFWPICSTPWYLITCPLLDLNMCCSQSQGIALKHWNENIYRALTSEPFFMGNLQIDLFSFLIFGNLWHCCDWTSQFFIILTPWKYADENNLLYIWSGY